MTTPETTTPLALDAKQLFLEQFTETSRLTPYQTLLSKTLSYVESARRMHITENDVRQAALSCGFSTVPDPLRQNLRDREEFARQTREILCGFKADVPVHKEALRVLSFLHDVLLKDESTRFTTHKSKDGSQLVVKLDSPRGIHAQFVQTDWDFFDHFDNDSDDETYIEEAMMEDD